jgi:hypothetical protein
MITMSAPLLEGQSIAGLLIGAVAEVLRMRVNEGVRQSLREGGGLVRAGVVHDDHLVHDLLGHHLLVRPAQRLGGVVRGHDHDDFLIFEHGL